VATAATASAGTHSSSIARPSHAYSQADDSVGVPWTASSVPIAIANHHGAIHQRVAPHAIAPRPSASASIASMPRPIGIPGTARSSVSGAASAVDSGRATDAGSSVVPVESAIARAMSTTWISG